jgi:putative ATPase
MRPRNINEFVGQDHLLGSGRPLRRIIENRIIHSMILWGPPGSGKTTLAKILATNVHAYVETISAVLAGMKDIREIVIKAKEIRQINNKSTILFVDEVHRFNKFQQDAFLPLIEEGFLTLIGATTENPSFELNNALLSRSRVYVLKRLQEDDILQIINQALIDKERGLGNRKLIITDEVRRKIVRIADGDARRALNLLEISSNFIETKDGEITNELLTEILDTNLRNFDKKGEIFYDQISALHKAIRGSDPDAALYWFCRIIDGGCDPHYVIRRTIRIASEDIGNADPRALTLALDAANVYERLGTPDGELALAQSIIYMACAAKSNAVYIAFEEAMNDVRTHGSLEVPLHLRNGTTKLMKQLGYGKNYHYPHNENNAYVVDENYLPNELPSSRYYRPVLRGLEIKIREKLEYLRQLVSEKSKK